MTVYETIMNRHSIRRFEAREVADDTVTKLLEAGRRAPSAGNLQPWFFYVVKNPSIRGQLAEDSHGQRFVAEAPVSIIICADPSVSAAKYHERGSELYCLQDTAAAAQNIMLAAVQEGLGTCWVGSFDEEKVRQTLDMPKGRRPVVIIPLGYPAKVPNHTSRKDLEQVCKWV